MADIFIGRRSELEALHRGLDQACAGKGSLALLVGEAGIGKTSVAREFAEHARQRGSTVLWGRCFEGDWQPPYGPWVEALSDIVRTSDGALLRRELGPVAPALAGLLPDIHALLPDLSDAPSLRPDEGRFRVYDAVVRFLSRVAARAPRVCAGLVLILDDLHWADTDSLHLLRYTARAVANMHMFVVGTYREPEVGVTAQHPLMQTLALVRSEAGCQHLLLRGLEYPELTEYLTQAAGQALPQALVQAVYAETDGNPFYTHEIWQHLTEEAKILHRAGRWSTDSSIDELGIPEGVRQVVGRRLTRLSDETNAMLHVAAGLSGEFGLEILQSLIGLQEGDLLDCLDEALEGGVLRVVEDVPPRYDFRHAIVRHTVYGALNPDRRLRLHRRIAQEMERLYAGLERDHAAEIAAQYYAARGLPGAEKGVAYALMATQQARAAYAHARAAALLRQARDLAPTEEHGLRAEILTQLALAEAEALMLDEAQVSAEEAVVALSAAAVEPCVQAEHLASMARALKEGGSRSSVWEPLVERGLALLDEPHDLLWARLMLLRNRYEHIVSEPLHVGHWLGLDPEAVAIARASSDEDAYALTLEPLEWRTREETEAVLAIARSWHRPAAIMRALDVVGRDRLYRHGAHREGGACYTELLAMAERYGSIPAQAEALGQISVSHIAQGDLASAQQATDRVLEIVARLGIRHRLRMFLQALPSVLGYYLEADWPTLAAEFTRFATDPALARIPAGTGPAAYAIYDHVRAGNEAEARRLLVALIPVLERVEPTM
ncbi:MAG: AAA family ATPase, partial [Anaerolineae bacterium]|nr:AAA family ATPase [Anaerolineae bacterium]